MSGQSRMYFAFAALVCVLIILLFAYFLVRIFRQ